MARPAQGPVATTVWACLAVAFACGLAGCAVHMEVLRDDPGEMINLAVEARHDEDAGVTLSIRDDGRGFDVSESAGPGHGLRNIRKRAQEHGIDVTIDSAPSAGTTVTLRFAEPS